MTLSRRAKIILLVLTLWPIIYTPFVMAFFFLVVSAGVRHDAPEQVLGWLAVLIGLTIMLALGLIFFYIAHILRNPRLQMRTEFERILWMAAVIFGSFIGQGVYWYLYIWRDEEFEALMR